MRCDPIGNAARPLHGCGPVSCDCGSRRSVLKSLAAFGATAALPTWCAVLDRVPQALSGAAALASILIAWSCALLH